MNGICPNCERVTPLLEVDREEEYIIRGEPIHIKVHLFQCTICGEEFEDPQFPNNAIEEAYQEYRKRKGMVQPQEICAFRKKFGLTQNELSKLLGLGGATLSRYENGALQSDAHDRILRMVMQPGNFFQLLKARPDVLGKTRMGELLEKLKSEVEAAYPLLDVCEDRFGSYSPDIFSGYKPLDLDKFINAILFFCAKSGVLKTKLNKLLFYADFFHFKYYSVSITGARYARLPFGPVPDNYNSFYATLIDEKKALKVEERPVHDYMGEFFIAQIKPDLTVFDTTELKILAAVKEEYEALSAKDISEKSHREKGYLETANSHLIPYSFADSINEGSLFRKEK
jgi:putative zinc finger/helix-turn-helix YgiT family protein